MANLAISQAQLSKLGDAVTARDAVIQRLRAQAKSKETQDNAMALGIGIGGTAAFCFLRGKMEAPDGAWNIPGTSIDYEALAVLGAVGLALGGGMLGKQFKKMEAPMTNVAIGLGGHYVGQLARKFGRTGQMSLVAGASGYGMLPSPGAGANSLSFRQTQMGPPFGDPIATALAESGV